MNKKNPLSSSSITQMLAELGSSDFVFLDTNRITEEGHCSFLFSEPVARLRLIGGTEVEGFLNQARTWLDKGFYLAGWLAYEMGYLLEASLAGLIDFTEDQILADLGVYKAPVVFDHGSETDKQSFRPQNIGGDEQNGDEYIVSNLRLNIGKNEYLSAIDSIKSYIAAGDTYQVNYTLKLLFDFHGSPIRLYEDLRRNQSVSYAAYIQHENNRILSFSPELFFRKDGNVCTVRPMKGTMKRGRTNAEDDANTLFLQNDAKNRSENVMIVDLLRNDLGRLSLPDTVKVSSLFDVEKYETLHQMTSTITGQLPDETGLSDLLKALFPCGSVTGAPKIRTMEIIRELEPDVRGVYTGAIGYLAPSGDAVFNVPIRTVVLENGRGEMGIGSGIVHDSDPENEWQECRLKAHFLTKSAPVFQLIETLLWQLDKGYWLLDEHLDRLCDSARYYSFSCDRQEIKENLLQKAESFRQTQKNQRVRLLLGKDGQYSITSANCDEPKKLPGQKKANLPKVIFSDKRTSSDDHFLFHKTTMRDLYNQERERCVAEGYYEVLFCNEKGEVTEGAISTVFVKKGDVFYTPPIACGLLPGVFRDHFLGGSQGAVVEEKILYPDDLLQADAVFVANSVRGIVPVELA
ncbi:MAG: aminodeoxychorismate synthase component I [Desulfobulbaceae bacterium]|nr:aminodeoxychorismate synthase component I [Desulfobulbaceae bacterium]